MKTITLLAILPIIALADAPPFHPLCHDGVPVDKSISAYFCGQLISTNSGTAVLAPKFSDDYKLWLNGVAAAWRWDVTNGNFKVAYRNADAFLLGTNYPALTRGQTDGAAQDQRWIQGAILLGGEPAK